MNCVQPSDLQQTATVMQPTAMRTRWHYVAKKGGGESNQEDLKKKKKGKTDVISMVFVNDGF